MVIYKILILKAYEIYTLFFSYNNNGNYFVAQ